MPIGFLLATDGTERIACTPISMQFTACVNHIPGSIYEYLILLPTHRSLIALSCLYHMIYSL